MIHLREFSFFESNDQELVYPFNIQALKKLEKPRFTSSITIFVGENGSGKSTLLEGIAKAVGLTNIGSDEMDHDTTLDAVQPLADHIKLVWNSRVHKGFFLRAEDFFGFNKRIHRIQREMQTDIHRIDREYQSRSDYARDLAKTPALTSLRAIERRYGSDFYALSHGESFLKLFNSRLVPGGLYLLDEPEAALSPISQLGLISMIKEMIKQEAQFILATHSPILMAIPEAVILDFDQSPPAEIGFDEIEHVQLFRSFLADPQAFLHRL